MWVIWSGAVQNGQRESDKKWQALTPLKEKRTRTQLFSFTSKRSPVGATRGMTGQGPSKPHQRKQKFNLSKRKNKQGGLSTCCSQYSVRLIHGTKQQQNNVPLICKNNRTYTKIEEHFEVHIFECTSSSAASSCSLRGCTLF